MKLRYAEMDSPIGILTLIGSERGLCRIQFGKYAECEANVRAWTNKYMPEAQVEEEQQFMRLPILQLNEYFKGQRKHFTVPLDLCGTRFQRQVWHEVYKIQYGKTMSYKEIAAAIKSPKAVRAVGGAVNKNPLPIVIPCHRVIGSNGSLIGYNGGIDKKVKLLSLEHYL